MSKYSFQIQDMDIAIQPTVLKISLDEREYRELQQWQGDNGGRAGERYQEYASPFEVKFKYDNSILLLFDRLSVPAGRGLRPSFKLSAEMGTGSVSEHHSYMINGKFGL